MVMKRRCGCFRYPKIMKHLHNPHFFFLIIIFDQYFFKLNTFKQEIFMVCWYFSLVGKTSRQSTSQCHRYGGKGAVPPLTAACASPVWFTLILFLEHHVTTRQQTMIEEGLITSNIIHL